MVDISALMGPAFPGDCIDFNISKEEYDQYKKLIEPHIDKQPKYWQTNLDQRVIGHIGEVCVCRWLGIAMKEKAFGKSDGGSDLNFSGKTWDVKTKLRNIPYLWAEYGHNVDDAQSKNTCDGYIFCSYSTPTMVMSICGWLPKFVFEKLAVAHKKDEIKKLPSGREFRFTKDCHEVANHQLFKPELLIKAAENFNRK